jgi:integrase
MKETDSATNINMTTLMIAFMAQSAEKLDAIEKKLEKKVAYSLVDDAVSAFRTHIDKEHKQPKNFYHILEQFRSRFAGKNVVLITANEADDFLTARWGGCAKTTFNKRRDQLSQFFEFCITELRRAGSPDFHNPVKLVKKEKVAAAINTSYFDKDVLLGMLDLCDEEHHWLWMSILASAGLRVSELLKLRACDVNGRVLTLIEPKSGRDEEYAVLSDAVVKRLHCYMSTGDIAGNDRIWPTTLQGTVYKMLKRRGEWVGLKIGTHSFRKWCATTYDRYGEYGMRRYVLRHSSVKDNLSSLESRYVAILSNEEAMEIQDRILGSMFEGGNHEKR